MSDFYIRKFDYAIYYPIIALRKRGAVRGLAVFKEYWYGRRVDRLYSPYNPQTPTQQAWRGIFYNGVKYWQGFDGATKSVYNREAERYRVYGYHRWMKHYLDSLEVPIIMDAWPIGSVFISVVSTDPADLLGYGTWSAIASGKVLVALDAEDSDFDTVEDTGGDKTKQASAQTFAGTPSTDIVNHTHDTVVKVGTTDGNYGVFDSSSTSPGTDKTITTGNPKSGGVASYTPAGTNTPGAATSIVQPYFVVYMWKRTA